jgi:hypothetical protein
LPARQKGVRATCFLGSRLNPKALVDDRGCRRDIRSSGWIEFSFSKTGPVEETSFLRSVRIDFSAVSLGPKPGRDLVLTCSPTPSFHLPGACPAFSFSGTPVCSDRPRQPAVAFFARPPPAGMRPSQRHVTAMVIASRNARVNQFRRMRANRCGTGVSSISYQAVSRARLHPVHRDT